MDENGGAPDPSSAAGDGPFGVRVRVPATSANLGPGFDAFGLALELRDDVAAWPEPSLGPEGLRLEVEGEGAASVPRDRGHLVVRAMDATFGRLGVAPRPLAVRCTNRIPHGRGLGSSAAAIVSGVLAARALVPGGTDLLDEADVLALAAEIEGHADNVAACLLGGLCIAWTERDHARAVRLDPAPGVVPVAFVAATSVQTSVARGLLPPSVPHRDAAHTAGRAALLVAALTLRPDLLLAATEDRLHQRYREPAMPDTAALVGALRARDVPAVVSGAGPTVLALVDQASVESLLEESPVGWTPMVLGVADGATVELLDAKSSA